LHVCVTVGKRAQINGKERDSARASTWKERKSPEREKYKKERGLGSSEKRGGECERIGENLTK